MFSVCLVVGVFVLRDYHQIFTVLSQGQTSGRVQKCMRSDALPDSEDGVKACTLFGRSRTRHCGAHDVHYNAIFRFISNILF